MKQYPVLMKSCTNIVIVDTIISTSIYIGVLMECVNTQKGGEVACMAIITLIGSDY